MIYFTCPNCNYKIANIIWNSAKFDYKCPKCNLEILSQFKGELKQPEVSEEKQETLCGLSTNFIHF